jgi:hypothetical protein
MDLQKISVTIFLMMLTGFWLIGILENAHPYACIPARPSISGPGESLSTMQHASAMISPMRVEYLNLSGLPGSVPARYLHMNPYIMMRMMYREICPEGRLDIKGEKTDKYLIYRHLWSCFP